MDTKSLRFLARRHAAGHPPRPCSHHDTATPCDAALLATEVARIRAWMDFASDLLDAHIWGFSAGDWQAADGLAHALEGSDWPPDWKRDLDNAACIIVDPSVWPTPGLPDRARSGKVLTGAHLDWLASVAERGFDPTKSRT